MRIRPSHLLLCGAMLVSPLAACGKDSKSTTTTTSGSSQTTATTARASGAATTVEGYCNDVAAFVKKAEPILSSKDRAAALALQPDAQKLAEEAITLGSSLATESTTQLVADQAKLKDCQDRFDKLSGDFDAAFGKP